MQVQDAFGSGGLSRRELICRGAALGVAGIAGRAWGQTFLNPRNLSPVVLSEKELSIDMVAMPRPVQILPGQPTNCWSYMGNLVKGGVGQLQPVQGSYLGPIIRARSGQQFTVRMGNQLGEDHITHWHGLDVPDDADGHPRFAYASGESRSYTFPILNRAGTYWYHPHPDMRTGPQVYQGLAGFFIVEDPEEQALPLPRGAFDVPLCIQDATFDTANQLVYTPDMMNGFFGSTVLVNGRPNFTLSAATRVYRLRLLNGCQSRALKLQFSDGTPMIVIGTDGGLVDQPRNYPYVILSPGERVELWVDLSQKTLGSLITLRSLAFTGGGTGQGAAFDVFRISIDRQRTETLQLPSNLSSITRYRLQDAVNAANPRSFPITMLMNPMAWLLNGGAFQMTTVAANEVVPADTLEVWRFTNPGGMMATLHPIHTHGRQFQILDRTISPAQQTNWQTVRDGYVDIGWKDTFMMMPGETVRILVRHSTYRGLFLYHCHNLVHEDMGMMRNFRIV